MKKFLPYYLLFSICIAGCQNDISVEPTFDSHFVKYYGSKGDQEGRDMVKVADGFVLLGRSDSDNLGKQVYVVKTDFLGNEQWNIFYGGIYNEDPASVTVTNTGELLVSATIYYPDGTSDMVFYLLADDGSKLDSLVVGTPSNIEVASDAIPLSTGDFMLLGTTDEVDKLSSPSNQESIISVYRTIVGQQLTLRPEGGILDPFKAFYGEGIKNMAVGIVEDNTSYYILGTSDASNASTAGDNLVIFSIDGNGSNNFSRYYGNDDNQSASKIIKSQGGFTLLGSSNDALSSKVYFNDVASSFPQSSGYLLATPNIVASDIIDIGNYIVLGTEVVGANDTNIYLCETDKFGNIIWETTFGGDEFDLGESGLFVDSDGGIVFLGTVDLESQNKMALIKVNNDGLLNP